MLPKRLVFCGGGTRCIVFVHALVELEKRGHLVNVQEYWGTSAGAMIASLYALSKSATRVKDLMRQTNFTKFRDVNVSNLFDFQKSWGLDDGTSLIEEIERIFEWIEPGNKLKRMSDVSELNIVLSDVTVRETIVCNAKTHPNLRIVEAVRASMSLPIFFRPYVHKETGNYWVDGAIRANFPWAQLPDDAARSESLGFTFEKLDMNRHPKSLMEYIFFMIHFDEPRKIVSLKENWKRQIIWFTMPPFPSWFVRLKEEDFIMLERLGKEGVERWLQDPLPNTPLPTRKVLELPNRRWSV